jgi:hypothetical protein
MYTTNPKKSARSRLRHMSYGAAAMLTAALPGVALAGPPPVTTPPVFTPQWWSQTFGTLLSDDLMMLAWRLVIGVLLFVAGWLFAKLVSWVVYRLLRRTDFDNRLAAKLGVDTLMAGRGRQPGDEDMVERGVARVVFWLLMALVIVGVLDYANLDMAAGPIQGLVGTIVGALPMIAKAILILAVAYFVGLLLRTLVVRGLGAFRLDARFAELDARERAITGSKDPMVRRAPFSEAAGQVVFWVVMAFGLIGAFDALEIPAISGPLSGLLTTVVGLLPAIGAAVLIGFGGYLLARIIRVIVTRTLEAFGFDRLFARLRLGGMFGTSSPSRIVGWLAMVLVLIQTTIAALDQLNLETFTGPLTAMMTRFWAMLPALAVSILIVIVGVIAGRLVRSVVRSALVGLGFDRLMERIGFGRLADRDDDLARPSGILSFVAQIAVVLLAIVQALRNLELDTWAGYVDSFLMFTVTKLAVALLIVIVGFSIGNYVRDLIEARQRPTRMPGAQPMPGMTPAQPVWMAEFARYAVLVFAFTMAVHQLGFAEDFVLVSFGLLFGALCLAGALAFGLGAREVAGEIVRERYQYVRQNGLMGPGPRQPPRPPTP